MRNRLNKYPKRIIDIRNKWIRDTRLSSEIIRSTFNINLYLDYLNAVDTQIKPFRDDAK